MDSSFRDHSSSIFIPAKGSDDLLGASGAGTARFYRMSVAEAGNQDIPIPSG
jgi:hypothetical protein